MTVHFYQPDSFLRTRQKTNPFFDPIVRVCEENGIGYRIFLPHCHSDIGYRKSLVSCTAWISVIGNLIWKVARIIGFRDPCPVYFAYAKVLRMLTVKRHTADIVISCGGALGYALSRLYPDSRVVDLQHGVIFSKHSGYFNKTGRLTKLLQCMPNREFWVYGQGYADCFFKHPDNAKDLQGRVKVIGDVIRAGDKVGVDSWSGRDEAQDVVVFSLQLTADLSQEEISGSVTRMEAFFADFFAKYGDKYKCFVKHHPRFNNVYDLSAFYAKFPQVMETKAPWTELYPQMALHVTFNSTVTFDCASQGIPTFLVDYPGAKVIMRNFYRDDYEYPFYDKTVDDILGSPREEIRRTIVDWYHRFYTPFSEENCLKLLKGMK